MKALPQFTYINQGNEWPFLHGAPENMVIGPDGSIRLIEIASGGWARKGVAVFGAIPQYFEGPWFRVSLRLSSLPRETRFQLFAYSADDPAPPSFSVGASEPFVEADGWRPLPPDTPDLLIDESGYYLWLGLIVRGSGASSPVFDQIRLESGRNTFIQLLPGIYSLEPESKDLTERFLKELGASFEELETRIENLPAVFDAAATPHTQESPWLPWLASWLDFTLSDAWSEWEARDYLGGAFELYGRRGTIPALRQYLKWYAGVNAIIEEPGTVERMWVLGQDSSLGFRTALSSASVAEAVLDNNAIVDESALEGISECTSFDPYAHRFVVSIFCAELTYPGALKDVRTILDREKPAHTEYRLCLLEPMMRVGAQARLGIDTIVAGSDRYAQLDEIVDGKVIADEPDSCDGDPSLVELAYPICSDQQEATIVE